MVMNIDVNIQMIFSKEPMMSLNVIQLLAELKLARYIGKLTIDSVFWSCDFPFEWDILTK